MHFLCEPLQDFLASSLWYISKFFVFNNTVNSFFWYLHCVLAFQFPTPSAKWIFSGPVEQYLVFTCSCVFRTMRPMQQESYLCLCPCCGAIQNFASSAPAFHWFHQLCFCFGSLLECRSSSSATGGLSTGSHSAGLAVNSIRLWCT